MNREEFSVYRKSFEILFEEERLSEKDTSYREVLYGIVAFSILVLST